MAYNNGFPVSYQPIGFYPQTAMQPAIPQNQLAQAAQPAQETNGILWVQGEAAAKSWAVAPGKSVMLMDSEANKFYIKSTDASGMPMPLRVFDYVEKTENKQAEIDTSKFVTKDELNEKLKELLADKEDK